MTKKEERVRRLLYSGMSATKVADRVGFSRWWVFHLARANAWPTNPTIHATMRQRIFNASHVCTTSELSRIYRLAPCLIRKVLREEKRREREARKEALRGVDH